MIRTTRQQTSLAILAIFALALAAATGCSKSSAEEANAMAEQAAAAAGEALSEGTFKMTAEAFYKDYSSLKGMDAMKYMSKKVELKGKVLRKLDLGEAEGYQVWMQAPGSHISLKFSDNGAAVKAKDLKKGDALTALCEVSGKLDKAISMGSCELK